MKKSRTRLIAAIVGFGVMAAAPVASAARVVVALGVPGVAVLTPGIVAVPVYPHAYYRPAYVGPPVVGYYGRPYARLIRPRIYLRGYVGPYRY